MSVHLKSICAKWVNREVFLLQFCEMKLKNLSVSKRVCGIIREIYTPASELLKLAEPNDWCFE